MPNSPALIASSIEAYGLCFVPMPSALPQPQVSSGLVEPELSVPTTKIRELMMTYPLPESVSICLFQSLSYVVRAKLLPSVEPIEPPSFITIRVPRLYSSGVRDIFNDELFPISEFAVTTKLLVSVFFGRKTSFTVFSPGYIQAVPLTLKTSP